ncbi:cytochrome P450 6B2 isoform X7 [Spodoptera frugiperda]|uniref:unspecific monooxygenase n=1 Tax=Spodoptera frugiperda TaxID=7108 RepID=A0A9R0DBD6_SPOFR|nr:cytochrome P450 6B2 isoform X7 [Spodoptera frugiperda]
MFVINLSLVIIVLCICLYYYFTRTFNYWKKRNVRGPKPTVFFGNIKDAALRKKNHGIVIQEIYDMFPNEKVVGIYRMTSPTLLVRDLDIIKHIMIKDFDAFTDRGLDFSNRGLGQNLFFADGHTWTALRSRFTPIFTTGKLKNMFYLINEGADNFVDYVSTECQVKEDFEVVSLLQTYTLSTISSCAFGISYDSLNDKIETLKIVDKILARPSHALELDMLYPGLLKSLNLSIFPREVQQFFKNLVDLIITQRNGKPSNRNDFMDLILELREMGEINSTKHGNTTKPIEITPEVMASQAFTFYLAGYETSATTMSYMLYQLAKDQDIQSKLRAEIDKITQANNGEITYETIKEMKYLNKVFDETLRMYSIVEPLQRKATRDYQIPGTDLVIEKDTIVLVSPRGIHYDEKYYDNPEVFNPDRFDPEVAGNRHPCAYLPFGIGQRNCIGIRFGKLQSQLCIAKILSKFEVVPSKNTPKKLEIEPDRVLIGPKGGLRLKLVPRKIKT